MAALVILAAGAGGEIIALFSLLRRRNVVSPEIDFAAAAALLAIIALNLLAQYYMAILGPLLPLWRPAWLVIINLLRRQEISPAELVALLKYPDDDDEQHHYEAHANVRAKATPPPWAARQPAPAKSTPNGQNERRIAPTNTGSSRGQQPQLTFSAITAGAAARRHRCELGDAAAAGRGC
jgi:hypothetical protein